VICDFILIIFISYATSDLDEFNIPYVAHKLEEYPEIDEALFWQEDTGNDIVDYMNDNIPRSDIFILFCSEQSLNSDIVKLEWKAALELRRIMIPVFKDVNHIPPILRSLLGVEFNNSDVDSTIQEIYETIGRKMTQDLEYENVLTSSQIAEQIEQISNDLQTKLDSTCGSRDLDMRIVVYPLLAKENLIKTNIFSELKEKLERNVSRGLRIDSISPAVIFNRLDVDQKGFYSISSQDLVGSIIIRKNGFIIYNFHYNKIESRPRNLLPIYYMTAYFLGFLELISFLYKEINYSSKLKLVFDVQNITEWKYSPYPDFLEYEDKTFRNLKFTVIEKEFYIRALENKERKFEIVEDIFTEMILGYGEMRSYNITSELKGQYTN
jgi:hypothetical protein